MNNKNLKLKIKSAKLGYRTPNIFRRNKKHQVAKTKIYATIKQYGKSKDSKKNN